MIYSAAQWLYSKRSQIKNGILIAAVCILWGRVAQCSAWRQADDHYGKKIEATLAWGDSMKAERDSLRARSDTFTSWNKQVEAKLTASAEKTREKIHAVRDSFPALTHSDSLRDEIIDSLVQQSNTYRMLYEGQLTATNLLSKALDNAEQVIATQRKLLSEYKPPKKPSRFSLGCTVGQAVNTWGVGPGGSCGLSVRLFP